MSVSQRTIDHVFAQIKVFKDGITYPELAKHTGLAIPTVRLAVSNLKMSNSVSASITRPVTIKAIERPPLPGQVITVETPIHIPDPLLDSNMIEMTLKLFNAITEPKFTDEMMTVLVHRVRENDPEQNHKLLVFLVNFTESVRQFIDTTEISEDDLSKLLD